MKNKPEVLQHRSIRLKNFDYSSNGTYFITICTKERLCLFGEVIDGEMVLNDVGKVIQKIWHELSEYYLGFKTDAFQIMPNHVHGIVIIKEGVKPDAPEKAYKWFISKSLGSFIRGDKTSITNCIKIRKTPGAKVFQRNYFECIIRDEKEYFKI